MNLKDKVAVVTGGSGGIGAAICKLLAGQGAKVARLDIGPPSQNGDALFVECDVTSEDSWGKAVGLIREQLGEIDVLFLNAGIMSRPASASIEGDPFELVGSDAYHRLFDVNLHGPVFGLKAARDSLAASGDARVIVTSSTTGVDGLSIDPYYAMSKHAVIGLVRSFAPVLEPQGIRIHAICPGGVKTPIVPEGFGELAKDFMAPETLAGAAIELLDLEGTGEIWVKRFENEPKAKIETLEGGKQL